MSTVPLLAGTVQGPLDLQQQANTVRQGTANLALTQQSIQENQLKIQQQQEAEAASKVVTATIAQNGGDLEKSLPQLAGKIPYPIFQGLQKAHIDMQEAAAKRTLAENTNRATAYDQLGGLVSGAKTLAPEQYGMQWPQLVDQAKKILPEVGNHLDPSKPIPQQALDSILVGFQTQSQIDGRTAAKQKQDLEAAQAAADTQNAATNATKADAEAKEFAAKQPGGSLYSPTEAALAVKAAAGDKDAEAALQRLDQSKRASRPVINNMSGSDAKDIADAIESGDQPPTLTGLYKNAGPVRAELARRGVPLAKMETDWKATQKYLGTLNGTQQVRLRQAISTASDSLDKIDSLYAEWQKVAPTSGVKLFNKVTLASAKQLPGRAGAVATALDAQIADLTSELGNVYMGGNSPTDHSLGLAAKNLSSDWNQQTFEEGVKQARANIKIRQNSILHAMPAGVGNEYMPNTGAASQGGYTPPAGAPTGTGPNGHKIVVDGGKWVDAQTGKPI